MKLICIIRHIINRYFDALTIHFGVWNRGQKTIKSYAVLEERMWKRKILNVVHETSNSGASSVWCSKTRCSTYFSLRMAKNHNILATLSPSVVHPNWWKSLGPEFLVFFGYQQLNPLDSGMPQKMGKSSFNLKIDIHSSGFDEIPMKCLMYS